MMPVLDNTEAVLYLQGFAPLIQLWAGICLLFFYESLLNKSPFAKLCDDIRGLYDNFKNKYNGLIPQNTISVDEYAKDHWSSNTLPTIKCIASTCFFYSVFILAFTGIEGCESYGGNYYCALQVTNSIILSYLLVAIIFYKKKIFHGFTPSIILTIIILTYFHLHFPINKFVTSYFSLGKIWDESSITIYTVFTCISGILLVCLRIFISWLILQLQKRSLRDIDKKFNNFVLYTLGLIKPNQLPKKTLVAINKRCNDKFNKGEITSIDNVAFLEEMKKEIANEYKDFTNKWWIKFY